MAKPTGPAAQTAALAVALVVPLCGGIALVLATALRSAAPPTAGMSLALVGNVLLAIASPP